MKKEKLSPEEAEWGACINCNQDPYYKLTKHKLHVYTCTNANCIKDGFGQLEKLRFTI